MVLLIEVIPVVFLLAFLSDQFADAAFGFDPPVLDWPAGWIAAAAAATVALGGLLAGRRGFSTGAVGAPPPRGGAAAGPPRRRTGALPQAVRVGHRAMAGPAAGTSMLTAEEQLREAFHTVSPLVAVGRRGEPVPELGADRMYVGGRWQQAVVDLIMRSRLVVLGLGPGEGPRWEVEQVTRLLSPQRLMLLLPADPQAYHDSALALARSFPRGLPAYPAGRQRSGGCGVVTAVFLLMVAMVTVCCRPDPLLTGSRGRRPQQAQ